jgi:hypothetical protein
MCHKQAESLLRRALKRFSARNYRIASPRMRQPDFGWDHAGVPLAFSMALATTLRRRRQCKPERRLSCANPLANTL